MSSFRAPIALLAVGLTLATVGFAVQFITAMPVVLEHWLTALPPQQRWLVASALLLAPLPAIVAARRVARRRRIAQARPAPAFRRSFRNTDAA
ncbi:MAG: hypothetical protein ACK5SH_14750 [Pseudomonadota bacterium]